MIWGVQYDGNSLDWECLVSHGHFITITWTQPSAFREDGGSKAAVPPLRWHVCQLLAQWLQPMSLLLSVKLEADIQHGSSLFLPVVQSGLLLKSFNNEQGRSRDAILGHGCWELWEAWPQLWTFRPPSVPPLWWAQTHTGIWVACVSQGWRG